MVLVFLTFFLDSEKGIEEAGCSVGCEAVDGMDGRRRKEGRRTGGAEGLLS